MESFELFVVLYFFLTYSSRLFMYGLYGLYSLYCFVRFIASTLFFNTLFIWASYIWPCCTVPVHSESTSLAYDLPVQKCWY